jgi:hypothetical protein
VPTPDKRQTAQSAAGVLLGIGAAAVIPNHPAIGYAALTLGILLLALLLPAVTDRLPRLVYTRGIEGRGILMKPAPGGRRKRLRREVAELARDAHAFLRARKPDHLDFYRPNPSDDDATREQKWHEHSQRLTADYDREKSEVTAHFGGRLSHAVDEFRRLGMLTEDEHRLLTWDVVSRSSLLEMTVKLESLAQSL